MKKIFSVALFFALLFGASSVSASTTGELTNIDNMVKVDFGEPDRTEVIDGVEYEVHVITDAEELEKHREEDGTVPKKKEIYVPKELEQEIELSPPKVVKGTNLHDGPTVLPNSWDTVGYYVELGRNLGTGWYDSANPYHSDIWVGPDEARIDMTRSITATYSGTFGADVKAISAEVGFSVSGKHEVRIYSVTPVPRGQTLQVDVFINHHLKEYHVYENNLFQADKRIGTGIAKKPIGAIFTKTWL